MNNYSIQELEQDVNFLVKRSLKSSSISFGEYGRDTGLSSNSIVAIAYGLDVKQELPGDVSDLAACERMWKKLPEHRKTEIVIKSMCAARECDYYGKDKFSPQQILDLVDNEGK